VFSHSWITDLEQSHADSYTFSQQFDAIQNGLVDYSQGCKYGGKNVLNTRILDFFSPSFGGKSPRGSDNETHSGFSNPVSNFDVELEVARMQYMNNPSAENLGKLNKEIAIQKAVDEIGIAIVSAAVPDTPYLASVPCKRCNRDYCFCFSQCLNDYSHTYSYCQYECCDEDSCYTKNPYSQIRDEEYDRIYSCVGTLSKEFSEACGSGHHYLLKTTLLFTRICKQKNANIVKALEEIHSQCSQFDLSAF